MNRNLIIAIIAILVIGGGYYEFSYKPAQEAAVAAQKAADEAAKAATDAAAATSAAATDAATAMADAAKLLDPANWDPAKVNAMIAASTLDDATKKTLTDAVTAAGTDAAKIGEVITQIKAALKM
jgi:hypothetical protein